MRAVCERSDTPASSGDARERKDRPALPEVVALWDWAYDEDFIGLLRQACAARGLGFGAFRGRQIADFMTRIESVPPSLRLLLDRASDVHPGLTVPLVRLKQQGAWLVNDAEHMARCRDKAVMHHELLRAGMRVPYSVVVSTREHPAALDLLTLEGERLGRPFVIKPAEGGGGEGVVLDARNHADVAAYLAQAGDGKIVLQRRIVPRLLHERRGWFRVFWALGAVIPCWWDDRTHIYRAVNDDDIERIPSLQYLSTLVALIARISRMALFTSEIAMDEDGQWVAVDVCNEMPDLRLQSRHPDGVPDPVVARLATLLAEAAAGAAPPSV